MTQTKFDELRAAVHDYGNAAFQNLLRSRALATAVIEGFYAYEGCPPENVVPVPATGPFDPSKDYGDEAFSFASRAVIILEPIRFGLCLIVGNAEDAGALWLRTSLSVEITGDTFDVYVAARPLIRVPLEFDGRLDPVFEAIHREYMHTFELEVQEFNDQRFKTGIGFMTV